MIDGWNWRHLGWTMDIKMQITWTVSIKVLARAVSFVYDLWEFQRDESSPCYKWLLLVLSGFHFSYPSAHRSSVPVSELPVIRESLLVLSKLLEILLLKTIRWIRCFWVFKNDHRTRKWCSTRMDDRLGK